MGQISFYYYCVLSMLLYIGIKLIWSARQSKGSAYVKFRKRVLLDTKKQIVKELSNPESTRALFEVGLKLDVLHFNGVRYMLLASILVNQLIKWKQIGQMEPKIFLGATGIFYLTLPVEVILGIKTPFGYVIQLLKSKRKEAIDKELFEAMTQLKNLCVVQGETPLSGDFLMEQLMKFTNITKPEFTKVLTIWRLGKINEACEILGENLDTKMGKEFSGILAKLESIHPSELAVHLELYQNHIREVRMTKYLRKQEGISYVLYAPVIASAFLVMLNFMVIVIWMDAMKLIEKI